MALGIAITKNLKKMYSPCIHYAECQTISRLSRSHDNRYNRLPLVMTNVKVVTTLVVLQFSAISPAPLSMNEQTEQIKVL
jgi:hypothetical protein